MNERYARELLAEFCGRLYDRQLTVSAGGNMSVRISPEEVIITPSGRNKGMLEPEDMVKVHRRRGPVRREAIHRAQVPSRTLQDEP